MKKEDAVSTIAAKRLMDEINTHREELGVSALQIHKTTGMTYVTAHSIMNGMRNPTLCCLLDYCDAIGLELQVVRKPTATLQTKKRLEDQINLGD